MILLYIVYVIVMPIFSIYSIVCFVNCYFTVIIYLGLLVSGCYFNFFAVHILLSFISLYLWFVICM